MYCQAIHLSCAKCKVQVIDLKVNQLSSLHWTLFSWGLLRDRTDRHAFPDQDGCATIPVAKLTLRTWKISTFLKGLMCACVTGFLLQDTSIPYFLGQGLACTCKSDSTEAMPFNSWLNPLHNKRINYGHFLVLQAKQLCNSGISL